MRRWRGLAVNGRLVLLLVLFLTFLEAFPLSGGFRLFFVVRAGYSVHVWELFAASVLIKHLGEVYSPTVFCLSTCRIIRKLLRAFKPPVGNLVKLHDRGQHLWLAASRVIRDLCPRHSESL